MLASILNTDRYNLKDNDSLKDSLNYRELYLECKKNVSLFMKQVENEISKILKNHEEEKKRLKSQIQNLKNQLKPKHNNSILMNHNGSNKSITHKKYNSELKQRNNTSVSKQTVEQCLAKFTGFDIKTLISDTRTQNQFSYYQKQRPSKKRIEQKENIFQPNNMDQLHEINMSNLTLATNLSRREKRFRQKKGNESSQKSQNIKDVLKNIRGKLSSTEKNNYLIQKQASETVMIKIISPDMFSCRGNNKS